MFGQEGKVLKTQAEDWGLSLPENRGPLPTPTHLQDGLTLCVFAQLLPWVSVTSVVLTLAYMPLAVGSVQWK